jgi:hypothetical protein
MMECRAEPCNMSNDKIKNMISKVNKECNMLFDRKVKKNEKLHVWYEDLLCLQVAS